MVGRPPVRRGASPRRERRAGRLIRDKGEHGHPERDQNSFSFSFAFSFLVSRFSFWFGCRVGLPGASMRPGGHLLVDATKSRRLLRAFRPNRIVGCGIELFAGRVRAI
jgi:hypothetical protein